MVLDKHANHESVVTYIQFKSFDLLFGEKYSLIHIRDFIGFLNVVCDVDGTHVVPTLLVKPIADFEL
jgi:hypothetical protein